MNLNLTIWGLVLLIVFAAANYASATVNPAYLWVGVAVIIVLLNMWMGKAMKSVPKGMTEVWMSVTVFGFITTLVYALWLSPTASMPLSWLMSFWMLLMGAAMFAGGHAGGDHGQMYCGVFLAFVSLSVPAFGQWYFLAGALFVGFFAFINGLLAKEK